MRRTLLIPSRPATPISLPSITTVSLPAATQGAAYTVTLAAIGGSPNYTWSITGALDSGLTLNASSGVISGVPLSPSITNLTFTVTDSIGGQGTKVLSLQIVTSNAPAITTTSPLPGATVGVAYTVTLAATGGILPYIWSYTGALTPGLVLNTVTGVISGTPTNSVSSSLTMKVTDNVGNFSTKPLTLAVGAATTLVLTTSTLPTGTVGVAYSAQLTASGGVAPYSFAYVSTTVPGLTVNAAGQITGTPTGTFNGSVGFKVTDAVAAVATFTWTFVVNATAGVGFDGTLRVLAGKFVNGSGGALQLKGANMQGLDASAAQGFALWYGSPPDWTTYKTWLPNVARIPLNAASFLGLSCLPVNATGNGWTTTTPSSADPNANYVAGVDTAIRAAQAIGCYVILDLHWSAPKFTFGGTTGYMMPLSQSAFMNTDTDLLFWQAIANRYGSQVTPQTGINNNGIAFELFNEPFLDLLSGLSNNATTWALLKSGGAVSLFSTNGRTTSIAQSWTALGYQTVLNAIRTAGAQNVCIVNGTGYSNASAAFASWMPTDSLSPAQLAVGQHTYPHGTYPYSNGDVFPNCFPDPNAGTVNWDAGAKAVIAAGIPLAITEDGGSYGPTATSGEPHVSYMLSWVDSHPTSSYVSWQYWPNAAVGASGSNYLVDQAANPTTGQGVVTHNWMVGAAGIQVPSAPILQTAYKGDTTATINWAAPSNSGGAPITVYNVYSNGTFIGTRAPTDYGFMSYTFTGLTNGTPVVLSVSAINAGGPSSVAAFASLTPGTPCYPDPPTNVVASLGPTAGDITLNWTAPAHLGGSALNSYNIAYFTAGSFHSPLLNTASTTLVFSGATAGVPIEFFVNAANAGFGISAYSQPSNYVTPASAGAPFAPTGLQLVLQGQNAANGTSTPPTPNNPNRQDISWTAAVQGSNPIASYKIYRSVNGGAFVIYGTSATTTFSDTAATLCVSGTAGSSAPFYAANTYQYMVSAVDSVGVEGPQSGTQDYWIYRNGTFFWGGDYDFALTSDYHDTSLGITCIKATPTAGYGGWLPYAGNLVTTWNMYVGAFKYIYLDIQPSVSGQKWQIYALRVGDVNITSPAGTDKQVTSYGPASVAGVWATYKIPLTVLLNDAIGGVTYLENAMYKFAIQDQSGVAGRFFFINNVRLSAT